MCLMKSAEARESRMFSGRESMLRSSGPCSSAALTPGSSLSPLLEVFFDRGRFGQVAVLPQILHYELSTTQRHYVSDWGDDLLGNKDTG